MNHSCNQLQQRSLTQRCTESTQPDTTESLNEIVNNGLCRAIFGNDEKDPLNILLYDLFHGSTTPTLAAAEFLTIARDSQDTESCCSDLAAQTISLASEYPFLQPHLVSLIASIMQSAPASFPSEMRICFVKEYATAIGDTTQSSYGMLFEEEQRRRRPSLVQEHLNLNRFIARLLSALGEPREPKEGLTHVNDALFILSTALEGHASSHQLPDVDVPAAAQYMIHAGELIFNECKNGSVCLLFRSRCVPPAVIHFVIPRIQRSNLAFVGTKNNLESHG